MRRVLTFAGRALATAVVIVAGAALVAGVLVPRLFHATPYTVLTGSMRPALPVGTMVVVRPSESIAIGDVITFQVRSGDPEVVTHRVVGVGTTVDGERRYTTRGDNNTIADKALVQPVQIRGKVWYSVPYLGYVATWLGVGTKQWVSVGVAALLVGYAGWQVVQSRRERRHRPAAPAGRHSQPDQPQEKVGTA